MSKTLRPAVAFVVLLTAHTVPNSVSAESVAKAKKDLDESSVAFHSGLQIRLTSKGVFLKTGCGIDIDRLRPEEITPDRHRALRIAATASDAGFDGDLVKAVTGGGGSIVVEHNSLIKGSPDAISFAYPAYPVEQVIDMPAVFVIEEARAA